MAKIIAVANQKGGVGKTTTCVNLSAALNQLGKRVLLVDGDPQGNASTGMGVAKSTRPNTYDMLINEATAAECVVHTESGDVIPASKELAAASVELIGAQAREYVMKNALMTLYSEYDYIFIDCPPSLELLTVNALVAADSVLIPMQCLNKRLEVEGIVLTMYDARANLTSQVAAELRKYLEGKVYDTVIPRSIRLSEAPSHGLPGIVYDKFNKGSRAYMELAREFIARNEN